MTERFVHLTPRLKAAAEMLRGYQTVADIGCDHGRLTAYLLQKQYCRNVIATDISEASLQKAIDLIRYIGLEEKVSFRAGDGLSVIREKECDAVCMLGIGGTLMVRILESAPKEVIRSTPLILQPMRAQNDIRAYLYQHAYRITEDRLIRERGRLYQVLRAVPDSERQQLPEGWPETFFDLGYRSFVQKDPLLKEEASNQLNRHYKRIKEASGKAGAILLQEKAAFLERLIQKIDW